MKIPKCIEKLIDTKADLLYQSIKIDQRLSEYLEKYKIKVDDLGYNESESVDDWRNRMKDTIRRKGYELNRGKINKYVNKLRKIANNYSIDNLHNTASYINDAADMIEILNERISDLEDTHYEKELISSLIKQVESFYGEQTALTIKARKYLEEGCKNE